MVMMGDYGRIDISTGLEPDAHSSAKYIVNVTFIIISHALITTRGEVCD